MTLTAEVAWTCPCGSENTDQLWVMDDAEKCGETFVNGRVPDDCDINWSKPCKGCGKYELSDDNHKTIDGYRGWDIVPTESTPDDNKPSEPDSSNDDD